MHHWFGRLRLLLVLPFVAAGGFFALVGLWNLVSGRGDRIGALAAFVFGLWFVVMSVSAVWPVHAGGPLRTGGVPPDAKPAARHLLLFGLGWTAISVLLLMSALHPAGGLKEVAFVALFVGTGAAMVGAGAWLGSLGWRLGRTLLEPARRLTLGSSFHAELRFSRPPRRRFRCWLVQGRRLETSDGVAECREWSGALAVGPLSPTAFRLQGAIPRDKPVSGSSSNKGVTVWYVHLGDGERPSRRDLRYRITVTAPPDSVSSSHGHAGDAATRDEA